MLIKIICKINFRFVINMARYIEPKYILLYYKLLKEEAYDITNLSYITCMTAMFVVFTFVEIQLIFLCKYSVN